MNSDIDRPTCPKCGGKKDFPKFLWTRSTGWGDVECGPNCGDSFHQSGEKSESGCAAKVQKILKQFAEFVDGYKLVSEDGEYARGWNSAIAVVVNDIINNNENEALRRAITNAERKGGQQ